MSASVSAAPLGGGWQGRERGCERERRKQKYLVHCPSFGCEAPSLGFALRTSRRSLSTKRGACLGSVSKRSLARHDAQAEAHFCSCLIISIAFKAASMSVPLHTFNHALSSRILYPIFTIFPSTALNVPILRGLLFRQYLTSTILSSWSKTTRNLWSFPPPEISTGSCAGHRACLGMSTAISSRRYGLASRGRADARLLRVPTHEDRRALRVRRRRSWRRGGLF